MSISARLRKNAAEEVPPAAPFRNLALRANEARTTCSGASVLLAERYSSPPNPVRTTTVTVVVCVKLPDVPVIVIVDDPVVAVLLAVNVNVLVPVAGFVPNAAVVPAPIPAAESVTAPVNPPVG